MKIYRHGDILIKEVDSIPKDAINLKTNVLAKGEVTGHAHRLVEGEFDVLEHNRIKYLDVRKDTKIVHEEHKMIEIPKQTYIVIQEREYDPFKEEIRKVKD